MKNKKANARDGERDGLQRKRYGETAITILAHFKGFFKMDNREILDALEDALSYVRSATDALKPVKSCDDVVLVLGDIEAQIANRARTLRAFVEAEEDAEQDALIREYYGGLL